MSQSRAYMSRRSFIRSSARLLTFLLYIDVVRIANAVNDLSPTRLMMDERDSIAADLVHPYGVGIYGQGIYPGYRINLPLVQNGQL
jgi:hypothetical protein